MHPSSIRATTRVRICIDSQELELSEGTSPGRRYPVSTSRYGLGTEEGSHCTPLGDFVIGERIGEDATWGTIFEGRKPVGSWVPGDPRTGDLILSRILWLDGAEIDNTNTRARYIYIHGTNEEDRIGSPASQGCIRMRNDDVIDLFSRVTVGTPVTICLSCRQS